MNTHHLQSEDAEEQVSFNMFNLIDLSEPRAEPISATLQINGKGLEMEVDTGASASVISQATYLNLWRKEEAPALKEANVRLTTYTGERIPLLGAIEVNVVYQGQEAAAVFGQGAEAKFAGS